ncbi:MAG TPA: type 1 glutamine amidotransferase domain-containing protein [Stellaceae bacterium]|nr:type 1 glutamine amidotransferase domain-containing protein [Stellaceae bacterium]
MPQKLSGKRIAILATDGFEEAELAEPLKALADAGAQVDVIAPHGGQIQGMRHREKGSKARIDRVLAEARPDAYDALVLPGGVANPDQLRTDPRAVAFVRHFFDTKKPVGAICHGPWLLAEADVARGREVTSWPSLRTDLKNAGARWVDREVVVDQGLVTSRKPDDLPAFCARIIEEFAEGRHPRQRAAE